MSEKWPNRDLKRAFEKQDLVSVDELRKRFTYDPETGIITHNKTFGKLVRGAQAGHRQNGENPYIMMRINKMGFLAHRVAWALYHGKWPETFVDHIDRNKSNNRIDNLRLATKSQNCLNRKLSISKYIGVSFSQTCQQFAAQIQIENKKQHIGYYPNEVLAAVARDIESVRLGYGFAPLNFPELIAHYQNEVSLKSLG